jgi:hypothetical protein
VDTCEGATLVMFVVGTSKGPAVGSLTTGRVVGVNDIGRSLGLPVGLGDILVRDGRAIGLCVLGTIDGVFDSGAVGADIDMDP